MHIVLCPCIGATDFKFISINCEEVNQVCLKDLKVAIGARATRIRTCCAHNCNSLLYLLVDLTATGATGCTGPKGLGLLDA